MKKPELLCRMDRGKRNMGSKICRWQDQKHVIIGGDASFEELWRIQYGKEYITERTVRESEKG